MSKENSRFQSRGEREREEALCCRYRKIGIPAVAAAKSALQHKKSQMENPQLAANASGKLLRQK